VLVDVAVAIADRAVTISDVQVLADQQGLHGPAGSSRQPRRSGGVLEGVATRRARSPRSGRPVPRRGPAHGWPAAN